MKAKLVEAITRTLCAIASCVLFSETSAAMSYTDYYYTGRLLTLSGTCTGDCPALPTSDYVRGWVEFRFDASGVSGTFSVNVDTDIFGYLNDTMMPARGSITLSDGKITDWSLGAFGSFLHLNASASTSSHGDGIVEIFDTVGFPPPVFHASLSGAGAPGVWSDSPASGPLPALTPLPTAIPLFATGVCFLGMLGWRRKRKA